MFDCPEASHTSPISTSWNCEWRMADGGWPGATVITCGCALAAIGSSFTDHLPLASAVAVRDWSAKETVTCSRGSAQPQTATGTPLWRTM